MTSAQAQDLRSTVAVEPPVLAAGLHRVGSVSNRQRAGAVAYDCSPHCRSRGAATTSGGDLRPAPG